MEPIGLEELEADAVRVWVRDHLSLVRESASGRRVLHKSLGISVAVGLAAEVGGFLLAFSATAEPLLLVADLLHALGWSLWTGVVVAVFVQIYPETRKQGFKQLLDAYENGNRNDS